MLSVVMPGLERHADGTQISALEPLPGGDSTLLPAGGGSP